MFQKSKKLLFVTSKILRSDARNPGAGLLRAAAAHRVPAADGQDLGTLEPAHLCLHEHLSKSANSKSSKRLDMIYFV